MLVEVAAAGICHTDLIIRDQWLPTPLPAVLGHEGAGVVSAVGSAVTRVAPGDRVAMSFNSCGQCPTCLRGHSTYCHDFFARNFAAARPDGTSALSRDGELVHGHFFGQSCFATHAVATSRNVVVLPDWVALRARRAVRLRDPDRRRRRAERRCGLRPGARIAVFGTGCGRPLGGDGRRGHGLLADHRRRRARRHGSSSRASSARRTSSTPRADDVLDEVARITGGGVDFASRRPASRACCARRSTLWCRWASAA